MSTKKTRIEVVILIILCCILAFMVFSTLKKNTTDEMPENNFIEVLKDTTQEFKEIGGSTEQGEAFTDPVIN